MYWSLVVVLLLHSFSGGECKATGDVAAEDSVTQYQLLGGILLVVSLVALVGLCAGGGVAPGNPIPNWVLTIVPDPALDTGFSGTSDGINAINNNCVHRHRRGVFEADGAQWGAALATGKHVFEVYWPSGHRGTLASIGVGTKDAPLFVKPRDSLVGCNHQSWGLDIARKRLLHRGEILGTMPRGGIVPDKFYMYVDCDGGTLGFGTDHAYWGAPINIPRAKFPVYAMIGCVCENAQITMIYRGSENKNNAPGAINAVTVPSAGPGGQIQVTVVNPGTVLVGTGGYAQPVPPPAYVPVDPAPSYNPTTKSDQPSVPVVEATKDAPPEEDTTDTHLAPVQVSGL